ncbi:EsV-1-163 [Ectocarpus siliculosus]|uniref:EsV-1-163 n=1 Tax=Ectocarpus siliculosus TaxID=2880 RepID=D7G9C0_ECTSI|nr:EsV-1-163 [Ectocarpus siliculosus]|eukprot:CBJ28263.1 EsV-1-163 [Ectocarpus siliculosus]
MVRTAGVVAGAALVGLLDVASVAGEEFQVIAPSEGMTVISSRTYTVEWTNNVPNSFVEIDLCYCGSSCKEGECGQWITSLCPYGEDGCHDIEGDYDVVMPEPMAGTSGGAYKGLTFISPETGDLAYVGQEYTVQFDYFSEVDSRVGRFNIELYEDNGLGGCNGEFVSTLCDKPDIGCKDSQGDYDIIMADVPTGECKIHISRFEDTATYGCSGIFFVVSDDGDSEDDDMDSDDDIAFSFDFSDLTDDIQDSFLDTADDVEFDDRDGEDDDVDSDDDFGDLTDDVHDSSLDTADDIERDYSYRF